MQQLDNQEVLYMLFVLYCGLMTLLLTPIILDSGLPISNCTYDLYSCQLKTSCGIIAQKEPNSPIDTSDYPEEVLITSAKKKVGENNLKRNSPFR